MHRPSIGIRAQVQATSLWLVRTLTLPRRLIGASLLRIGLGVIVAYNYVGYFGLRHFIWGPCGQIPYSVLVPRLVAQHDPFNLYALSPEPAYFELIFVLGLVVCALYIVGWRTRVTGALMFAFTWSLLHRNEEIVNGGHSLTLLILFYLMFADVGSHMSLDQVRRQRLYASDTTWSRILAMLHNYAIALCIAQVMIMYLFSTLFKLEGHKWQDGTALYYVLRAQQFALPPFSEWIYSNTWLVTLGTYGTLLFQGAFPWLIFHRNLKWVVIPAALVFHTMIALLMGLVWFSASIIVIDLILIDDDAYRRFYALLKTKARQALTCRLTRHGSEAFDAVQMARSDQ